MNWFGATLRAIYWLSLSAAIGTAILWIDSFRSFRSGYLTTESDQWIAISLNGKAAVHLIRNSSSYPLVSSWPGRFMLPDYYYWQQNKECDLAIHCRSRFIGFGFDRDVSRRGGRPALVQTVVVVPYPAVI